MPRARLQDFKFGRDVGFLFEILNRKKIRKIFTPAFGKIAGGGIFLQNMLANGNQKTSDIAHIFAPA